jgi:molecular chaperone DnaJ
LIDDPCDGCGGVGVRHVRRSEQITVPAGVKTGTKIRKKGRGQVGGRGMQAGDLIVTTHVTPSRKFTRNGDDLEIDVPITFAEAALGAKVEVPTLEGRVSLTVPPGSPSGKALRVKGKGAPRLKGSGHGDLIARLRIDVPAKLSDEQREALKQYAELNGANPRDGLF